jgi:hypothetical protein
MKILKSIKSFNKMYNLEKISQNWLKTNNKKPNLPIFKY